MSTPATRVAPSLTAASSPHPRQVRNKFLVSLAPTLQRDPQREFDDDVAMLRAIFESGAEDESEVNWSRLLPGIDGPVTAVRFRKLTKLLDKTPRDFGEVKQTNRELPAWQAIRACTDQKRAVMQSRSPHSSGHSKPYVPAQIGSLR